MLLLKIVAYQSYCVTVLNRLIGDFAHGRILDGVKEPMVYAVLNKQLQFKIFSLLSRSYLPHVNLAEGTLELVKLNLLISRCE